LYSGAGSNMNSMQYNSSLALLRSEHDHIDRDHHVGMLVYWLNTTVETELPRLGLDRLTFHYARVVPKIGSTTLSDEFLASLVAAIPDAHAQIAQLPLSATLVACTASGFTSNGEHPGGVASAFDALVGTLARLRAERIVLLTPYPDGMTKDESEAFSALGIGVSATAALGCQDGWSGVTSDEIRSLVGRVDPAALREADAVVLSCTGWRTLHLIPELESALGCPVLSSNVALASHAVALVREHAGV
jgi:maleate isomerase